MHHRLLRAGDPIGLEQLLGLDLVQRRAGFLLGGARHEFLEQRPAAQRYRRGCHRRSLHGAAAVVAERPYGAQGLVHLLQAGNMGQVLAKGTAVVGEPVRPHAELHDRFPGARRDGFDRPHIAFRAVHAGSPRQLGLQQHHVDAGIVQHGLDALHIAFPVGEPGEP